jgi:hypothetical protein
MKKLRAMAQTINGTAMKVRVAWEKNDFGEVSKEKVFQRALSFPLTELEGANLTMTGDNWLWPSGQTGQEESLYPDLSASIALTERDENGQIIRCAMSPIANWGQYSVAADRNGLYVLNHGGFFPITSVKRTLLNNPPRVYIFGQKSTPHWVAMNQVIGEMNRQGIRTQNDCGPYYGIISWFGNLDDSQAIIPRNVVYLEPYNNKPKEELMAFMINSLNNGLDKNQFVLTTISGFPVFKEGEFDKISDGKRPNSLYSSSGFIIAPTEESYQTVLATFKKAVAEIPVFSSPKANEKMQKLRQDLES